MQVHGLRTRTHGRQKRIASGAHVNVRWLNKLDNQKEQGGKGREGKHETIYTIFDTPKDNYDSIYIYIYTRNLNPNLIEII